MRLLVSVTDPDEADAAVAGGADIVDVKNPSEGSLGAPAPGIVRRVRAAVPARLPVSVALGDLPALPGTAALAAVGAAYAGAAYVKVGLWGTSTVEQAVRLLCAVREALDEPPRAALVACAYADAERVRPRPLDPRALVRTAREAGADAVLLDTAIKDGRGLLQWLGPRELGALVVEARAAGLEVGLAGSRRAEDLPTIRATGADVVGVRSAACRDGRRDGPLDPECVGRLRALC